MEEQFGRLIRPMVMHSTLTVLSSIHGKIKGAYAWWFRPGCLPSIPTEGTAECRGMQLFYVGIGPVDANSRSNLRQRLGCHVRPDASRSTLRRSLGCLLADALGLKFEVVRTSSDGKSLHYGLKEGEPVLSQWLETNALVSWIECATPWEIEKVALSRLVVPLNVDENDICPFSRVLHALRMEYFAKARDRYKKGLIGVDRL